LLVQVADVTACKHNNTDQGDFRTASQLSPWLEVVVGAPGAPAALAAPRERPDEDGRLGVAGQAEGLLRAGLPAVDLCQILEDGMGLLHFFWGRLLTAVPRRKPRRLSLEAMVRTEGNCSSV